MDPLVPSLAATKLFPRLLFPALCCTIVPAGCTRNDSLGTADRHDASQSETAGPGSETAAPDGNPPSDTRLVVPAEVGTCSNYPSAPRVDSAGVDQWSWYLHWFGVTGDLASTCASYGAGAKMVLEVDVPQDPAASNTLPDCSVDEVLNGASQVCAIAGAYRFEADCAAGKVLFEMPSQYTFHGYYHIEGPLVSVVYRQLVSQDVHCTRDLYLPTGLAAAPSVGDAGAAPADATADGSTCPSPGALAYDTPGCGFDAKLVCHQFGGDTAAIGIYYCGCNGRTIMGGIGAANEPYQFEGCCPGDSGFGPLGSYSCPLDGGLPYLTPPHDGGTDGVGVEDTGTSPDGQGCSFDTSGSPGSYDACVAAGGRVVLATTLAPTFCAMEYPGYGPADFNRCRAAGGDTYSWDVWCPTGTIGGDTCAIYYPHDDCPTGRRPDGYSWPLPSCS